MTELLHSPLFALALSLGAFLLGVTLYRYVATVLLHPIVTASLVVVAVLVILDIPYRSYQNASGLLYALLGPAVVALAVPLKQNLAVIRRAGWPLLVTIAIGAILAPAIAIAIALLLGAGETALLALSGKSITTPIALALAEKMHAALSLTAGIVVFTGIVGALWRVRLCCSAWVSATNASWGLPWASTPTLSALPARWKSVPCAVPAPPSPWGSAAP
ncbi:LrgB family protein [Microbulbifer sp. 2205BS26-8]|nr:LrgB family protein [Microbulbifer sp. 2205BS26-8]MDP5210136.1 LrgB family protein [Microbulbifer sp. 2205BS26-8]